MSTTSVSIELTVNGTPWAGEVPAEMTLLRFIREVLALTGTKEGCGIGECSACVVILDGRPVNACLALAAEAHGATLRTIEGEAASGELTPLQDAFVEHHAVQCGFCTPGMIMSGQSLLDRTPNPTDDEIAEAMAGNFCRCTGYAAILSAVRQVADGQGGDA